MRSGGASGIELELPRVFTTADGAALGSQRAFMRLTRLQLFLLIVAGAAGLFAVRTSRFDLAALMGGVAFVLAATLRFAVLRRRLHKKWYEGRAAAESIKTLAFRYAYGGHPFPAGTTSADALFAEQVKDVLEGLSTFPESSEADLRPTEAMDARRNAQLEERRRGYLSARIQDQVDWYTSRASWNRVQARLWGTAILVLQIAGATGAFLKAFGVMDLDVFGLAAALVGSAAAWLETRQHGSLASAYAVAADELRKVASLVEAQDTEERWARFLAEAEEAISREHTMWKASSSQRGPASLT